MDGHALQFLKNLIQSENTLDTNSKTLFSFFYEHGVVGRFLCCVKNKISTLLFPLYKFYVKKCKCFSFVLGNFLCFKLCFWAIYLHLGNFLNSALNIKRAVISLIKTIKMDLKIHNTQGQLISQFDIETGLTIRVLKKKILDVPCRHVAHQSSKLKILPFTTTLETNYLHKLFSTNFTKSLGNAIVLGITESNSSSTTATTLNFPLSYLKLQQHQLQMAKIPVG